jgi:L-amino acid N-acyltransferase YncA
MTITIRKIEMKDYQVVWRIFRQVVATGDTYAYSADIEREEALEIWIDRPRKTYVAELDGVVVGTYYIKTNQPGLGNHICNAGYMVAAEARGKGVGRAMAEHSLVEARRMGYHAMQFNMVVSTNSTAVKLWQSLGFEIVGVIPQAFNHAQLGLVDAYVMYKRL